MTIDSRHFAVSLLALSVAFTTTPAFAETLSVPYVAAGSDDLSGADWEGALRLPLMFEAEPVSGRPAGWTTDALVLHDGTDLLVRVVAIDPDPALIRATQSRRDNVRSTDDQVTLSLTADEQSRRSFIFTVNARGVQADRIDSSIGDGAPYWNGSWEGTAEILTEGYKVDFKIPLQTVGVEASGVDPLSIRVNVSRRIGRDRGELLSLANITSFSPCEECQFPEVVLTAPPSQSANVQALDRLRIQPYILAGESASYQPESGNRIARDTEVQSGVDVTWNISARDTLVATLNPDFSQVEIDEIQFQVNERFARSLIERRPFFTNESNIFNSNLQLLYTRSMVNPDAGLQYIHRSGDFEFGGLLVEDSVTSFTLPGLETSSTIFSGSSSHNAALRGRWRVGDEGLRIGGLVTHRSAGSYKNDLASVDTSWDIGDRHSFSAQAAFSSTCDSSDILQGRPAGCSDGNVVLVEHAYGTDEWFSDTGVSRISDGFRADLGRINQVGVTDLYHSTGRFWKFEKGDLFETASASFSFDRQEENSGGLLYQVGSLSGSVRTKKVTYALSASRTEEAFEGSSFHLSGANASLSYRARPNLTINLQASGGDGIYYADLTKGDRLSGSLGLTLSVGTKFEGTANFSMVNFSVDGERVFRTFVGDVRAEYHLSEKNHVNLIVGYGQSLVYREPGLEETATESENLNYQVTYQYRPSAFSYFVLGVSTSNLGGPRIDGLAKAREYAFAKWVLEF